MAREISRRQFMRGMLAGAATLSAGSAMHVFAAENEASVNMYTPGTYSAKAQGMGEVTVTMTFSETAITDVQLDVAGETPEIGQAAAEELKAMLLNKQSAEIDAVAGASVTSKAVSEAALDCVAQAMGVDVESLKSGADAEEALGDAAETKETEVVICGAGAAGLMAALNLTREGRKVMILECGANAFGSNFAMCGGPAACETKLQEQENEWVSLDKLFNHMYDYSNTAVNAKLLRKVLSKTGKAMNDMIDLGIPMTLWPDVYDNGFRARHLFSVDKQERIEPIVKEIEANGGEFIYGAKAKEPVCEDGKVVGVKAKTADGVLEVRAKAVLVTTGGFLGNEEMQKQYLNTTIFPLGNTACDGTGIELAHKAGAVNDRTFAVLGNEAGGVSKATTGWPFDPEWKNLNVHYTYWLFGGLYTDADGYRFINEEKVARFPLAIGGEAILRQGKAYVVLDSDMYEGIKEQGIYAYMGSPEEWVSGSEAEFYYNKEADVEAHLQQAIEEGWAVKADTLAEIAEKFGLKNLETTVAEYNGYCESGEDTEFYKSKTFLKPVQNGPFYCFEYVPSAWGTNGGIKVNANLQALNNENQPIEGLYVAGVDIGSMYTMPYYDNPGSSVGLAVGSGVLAAEEIAKVL
ncbi:MAG: FAD-binding protein [Eubacteriales bacterium]|nr:FAD-binding protein [Eubacteriales bacterium]